LPFSVAVFLLPGYNAAMTGKGGLIVAATLAALAPAGCVERTLTITSDPPGALAVVSGVEKGRTPLVVGFTWYGDYAIELRKDGYQALKTHYNVLPPVYEIPPFDLLSQLAPWTYHDRRSVHLKLSEQVLPSEEELFRNAEELRARNLERVGRW
jgi:hypothetical protein